MEFEVSGLFMSCEEAKMKDMIMHKVTFFIEGQSVVFYLSGGHRDIQKLYTYSFGERVNLLVGLKEHPKVSNAYKLRLINIV